MKIKSRLIYGFYYGFIFTGLVLPSVVQFFTVAELRNFAAAADSFSGEPLISYFFCPVWNSLPFIAAAAFSETRLKKYGLYCEMAVSHLVSILCAGIALVALNMLIHAATWSAIYAPIREGGSSTAVIAIGLAPIYGLLAAIMAYAMVYGIIWMGGRSYGRRE